MALTLRQPRAMDSNPHFLNPSSWEEAATMLAFVPVVPAHTEGFALQSLAVFVMDHKHRDVPVGDRSLEAHYGGFVLSQSMGAPAEARRKALDLRYGAAPHEMRIVGREGRAYRLGPVPEPDDIDPRMPAVIVWHDADMFFLVASDTLEIDALDRIARSLYDGDGLRRLQQA